jgi:predicted HD phosphohydrolase
MHSTESVLALYARRGDLAYDGEGISQLTHGWQCAQLALRAGASPALQLAAWLHDLGHLLTDLEGSPTLRGIDDRHEITGASVLLAIWGADVAEPVRLHVQAKRYRVATQPDYLHALSPDSVRSLALQGGPMGGAECLDFAKNPYALAAQKLRAWDDAGKRAQWFPADRDQALGELRQVMAIVSAENAPV